MWLIALFHFVHLFRIAHGNEWIFQSQNEISLSNNQVESSMKPYTFRPCGHRSVEVTKMETNWTHIYQQLEFHWVGEPIEKGIVLRMLAGFYACEIPSRNQIPMPEMNHPIRLVMKFRQKKFETMAYEIELDAPQSDRLEYDCVAGYRFGSSLPIRDSSRGTFTFEKRSEDPVELLNTYFNAAWQWSPTARMNCTIHSWHKLWQ